MSKFINSSVLLKSLPVILITGLFLLFTIPSPLRVSDDNKTQTPKVSVRTQDTATPSATIQQGENSVKVNINSNSAVNTPPPTNSTSSNSTCTVTKNGVTTTVPAGSVNVDEKSSGDVNVKVDCNNNVSSSSNYTVENKINIKANSSSN